MPMITTHGYAVLERGEKLTPFTFARREPGPADVVLALTHCGVCHTDLHFAQDSWGISSFPLVPGHEIVGRVTAVGADVVRFRVGDLAAVGTVIDSCRECPPCVAGDEHACERQATLAHGSVERGSGAPTYGGYCDTYVVDERFALRIPARLDPAAAAPLLCAGITTYSPLRHWSVGPGTDVGVVGLGGLGHMAVKFASALGARVVLFTTSAVKAEGAARLGADEVVLSRSDDAMQAQAGRLDFVLDTVSADHDLGTYLSVLRRDGTLCLVGSPVSPAPISAMQLQMNRRRIAGSMTGGLRETQEMLDFCGEHGITADIELITIDQVDRAYERMVRGDVRYRFVIDLASLHPAAG
jgi:alcohol dehydrogenase (NADP+)